MLCTGNERISYSSRKYLSIINFKEYTGEKRTFVCFYLGLGGIISNSGFIILLGGVCVYLSRYAYLCFYLYVCLNGLLIERETHGLIFHLNSRYFIVTLTVLFDSPMFY